MKNSILRSGVLVAISIIATFALLVDCDEIDQLPGLWSNIGADKSYHVMYQLHMLDSKEKITVEEWASFDKKQFRLDLISIVGRISYLTDGNTGEILRFKPYTCDLLKSDSNELRILRDLFQGYNTGQTEGSDDKILAYGIGPLWLRALDASAKVQKLPKNPEVSRDRYESYSVKLSSGPSSDQAAYDMVFRFSTNGKFLDIINWIDPSQSDKIIANVIVIQKQFSIPSTSVFQVPVGYGCQRSAEFDHPLKENTAQKLLQDLVPNQAVLQVTASRPRDELLRKWDSEKYTIRIMRGALKLNGMSHSYWVTMTQSRDLETSRLKRTKLIWSAEEGAEQAVVYTIDDILGICQVNHQKVEDHIRLSFPISNKESRSREDQMSIGTDMISYIMNDQNGYHLIREETDSRSSMLRDIIYERRMNTFRELDAEGNQVWSGPVSVIKEISYVQYTENEELLKAYPLMSRRYHTVVTILFFSEDKTRIEYKAVIDVLEQSLIDASVMHKEMDISRCLPDTKKQEVVIRYPIESEEMSKKLEGIQDMVKVFFTLNLFGTTSVQPLQVSNIALDFDNYNMYFKLTLLDLPLTQIFNMRKNLKLKADKSDNSLNRTVVEQLASNVDRCASSCDHYHCSRFSYDPMKLNCRIEIKPNGASIETAMGGSLYEKPKLTIQSLWSKYEEQIGERSHLKPRQIVDVLQELIGYSNGDSSTSEDKNDDLISRQISPLVIRMNNRMLPGFSPEDPEFIYLKPLSIGSDFDSFNEFLKEESIGEDGKQLAIRINEDSNLRVEYNILFENKVLSDSKAETYEGLSYDQCERLCEDNNCKSFSYCNYNMACIISTTLHSSKDIQYKSSYNDARCNIFVLDYLSKFEDFGRVKPPASALKSLKSIPERDCANACMEEEAFSCQSFYFCTETNSRSQDTICLMNAQHIQEMELSNISKPTMRNQTNSSRDFNSHESARDCRLYSRSYLAQFNEYHAKKLEVTSESDYETLESLGAENCAKLCIQKSCLAFDICLDKSLTEVCQLAHKEVRKSSLTRMKGCTSFVLSDKSHFNREKTLLVKERPDKQAEVRGNEQGLKKVVVDGEALDEDLFKKLFDTFSDNSSKSIIVTQSHWLAKLVSLLAGVVLGVGCLAIWRRLDDVYILVSGLADRFRQRG